MYLAPDHRRRLAEGAQHVWDTTPGLNVHDAMAAAVDHLWEQFQTIHTHQAAKDQALADLDARDPYLERIHTLEGTVSGLRAELAATLRRLERSEQKAEAIAQESQENARAAEQADRLRRQSLDSVHGPDGPWVRLQKATARVAALEKVATDAQNARQEVADQAGSLRTLAEARLRAITDREARLTAAQVERDELRARITRAAQALEGAVDTASALEQARQAHLAHLRTLPESRCSAHGSAPCDYCAPTKAGGLDDLGNCTQCSVYASTGHHWDTCPNRIR